MQEQPSSQLTPSQVHLCQLAQKFSKGSNSELQSKLKQSNWRDIYAIITNPQIDQNIRVVCCSILKWLIYHKKFVDDPMGLFCSLGNFYLIDDVEGKGKSEGKLTKAQEIVEMVLEVIPGTYMTERQKVAQIDSLLKNLDLNLGKSPRILTIIKIILENCQVDNINNQVIAGQLLIFLEKVMKNQVETSLKIFICEEVLKLIQFLVELVNNEDEVTANHVQEFLSHSSLAKRLIESIIADGSNNQQVISTVQEVNRLKHLALQVYSGIWIYSLDEPMFRLMLSTLLTKPPNLIDQQAEIMERVVVMLQRSISQEQYYNYLHSNIQRIIIALLSLLTPKESYLKLMESDPDQFVDILYDFCMEQQRELLEVKVGSLISALTMYIDGYMSFIGSLCIVIIKKFNGTFEAIPGGKEYMDTINTMWEANDEEKTAACVMVLCAISDQLDKREDLLRPLRVELANMTPLFSIQNCKFPPYLTCRFMFLYSFIAFPKCLDIFLPYKAVHPVYQHQLQCCYKILQRYYNRYPECKKYIDEIGPMVIMSDQLTSLLESTIMTGQLSLGVQYKILEKLVGWLDEGVEAKNNPVCNKMANLISILITRMEVNDYAEVEEAVFGYLEHLFRLVSKSEGAPVEQFIIQICVSFVKRFPSLEKSNARLMAIMEMGFKIVQRNNGVLNTCLDLFFEITRYLPYEIVRSLVQILLGCLESQEREEDQWECYYGLENCMLRIHELGASVPQFNLPVIIGKVQTYKSPVLKIKAFMFICSVILASLGFPEINYLQCFSSQLIQTYVPPYINKPYLLYLLLLYPRVEQTQGQSLSVLILILDLMKRQKDIKETIKKYEEEVYCNMIGSNELEINALGVSTKLVHPFLMKNFELYNEFRKCWGAFQNKEYIQSKIDEGQKKTISEFCTQTTINSKVRKIVKVKSPSQMENESQMS